MNATNRWITIDNWYNDLDKFIQKFDKRLVDGLSEAKQKFIMVSTYYDQNDPLKIHKFRINQTKKLLKKYGYQYVKLFGDYLFIR